MPKKATSKTATAKATGGVQKKKKDPNAPKRPLSAYFMFQKEIRPSIVKKNPDLKLTEISKEIGDQWKTLDAKQRVKYEKLAEEDKSRYEREMKAYKES